jgi:2-polyprenyl-3-methyl-5-hydroxy-6-metoxy-1,4-benzoquinol methylase
MSEADSTVARNREAWNAHRYEVWVAAYGTPEAEARTLVADPAHKLRRFQPHLGDVAGQRVCSVQGSSGRVAVALALLGADATVIDFAEENRRYALELAAAAGVAIDYHLGDVIEAGSLGLNGSFDWVVMELGILHYHQDLLRFFQVMRGLVRPGGRMLVHEFHPVRQKVRGRASPDYFGSEPVVGGVPGPRGQGRDLGQTVLRLWTLAEIVNASLDAGFRLDRLEEHPDWEVAGEPGLFTLLATAV